MRGWGGGSGLLGGGDRDALEGVNGEGVEELVGDDEGHFFRGWGTFVSKVDMVVRVEEGSPMGIDLMVSVQTMGRALYLHTLW